MNYTDIKRQILENWEQFAETRYPEDLLNEFVESALPVYYSEIISDWQQLPSEFDDIWAEEGYESDRITGLMLYDLQNYYSHEYTRIYSEVCEEMPTREELEDA
jgi:hypothetical protein